MDFPGGPVAKTLHSQGRGPGLIPSLGARSCTPQLRVGMLQLKRKKKIPSLCSGACEPQLMSPRALTMAFLVAKR